MEDNDLDKESDADKTSSVSRVVEQELNKMQNSNHGSQGTMLRPQIPRSSKSSYKVLHKAAQQVKDNTLTNKNKKKLKISLNVVFFLEHLGLESDK